MLSVAPHVPYPGVPHAGGDFLLRHLLRLAQTCRVTLLVPAPDGVRDQLLRVPDALDLVAAPPYRPPAWTPAWLADRVNLRLHDVPPAPHPEHLRGLLHAGLVERARAADVVELHWADYARLAPVLRQAGVSTPIVVVEYDVDAEVVPRRLRALPWGRRRLLGELLLPGYRRREVRGLQAADLVLVFKQEDAELVGGLGVATEVVVLDPWLEVPDGPPGPRAAPEVLFTGAMWRRENGEGALWLLERVWPAVRAALPDARLVLAGAGPTPQLLVAAVAAGGVEVTGEVPELGPFYERAQVFVAPLLTGGGLKFKVPQAMVHALPVVATSVAAEGVVGQAPPGTFWAVSDDPSELSRALLDALTHPEDAAACGRRAADWAGERYRAEAMTDGLRARYADWATASSGAP